jgi:hypothetical protein
MFLLSLFDRFFSFAICLNLKVSLDVVCVQPVLYMGAVGFGLKDRDLFVADHVRDYDSLWGEMGEIRVFFGEGNSNFLESILRMQEQVSVLCIHEVSPL